MNWTSAATFILLSIVFFSCGGSTSEVDPEAAGVDTEEQPDLDNPNAGNTDIYDVDVDDPYLVSNGTFLGLKPGEPLNAYEEALRKGSLKTGEGTFEVYYIDGAEGDELGYARPDPLNEDLIGDIYITSRSVVTEKGIRIGTTYEELIERVGRVSFHGSEIESRVYGNSDGMSYRLDMVSADYDLDNSKILPDTEITELVISRKRNM